MVEVRLRLSTRYCKSEMPYNLDEFMLQCHGCQDCVGKKVMLKVLKDNTVKKEELCARAKAFADSLSYPSGVNICTIGTPSVWQHGLGNQSTGYA
ncbi:hypothetical protein L1987_00400 [Smallanthus sonchifolius]|uniref:Uncharacterized protein n=1 Tax=Smallanthus sonchifolius TaxID=185202 RepID=A0ACB9K283_9ASTR|nr:hypothetical protein L1987_00400 [Smallanthus sonchifolius]